MYPFPGVVIVGFASILGDPFMCHFDPVVSVFLPKVTHICLCRELEIPFVLLGMLLLMSRDISGP